MQHDLLDSLGLNGISASVTISGQTNSLRIATPSKSTIWRRVCSGTAPSDSGIVFGVARLAGSGALVSATPVVATWRELRSTGKAVAEKGWRLETTTSATGEFVLCGMPLGSIATLQVVRDSLSFVAIEIGLDERSPIRRRDLVLSALSDSSARGTIMGRIVADTNPVANARVQTDAGTETRSDEKGRFSFRGIPAGTRQLYVQAIGIEPTTRVVDVPSRDTAHVTITVGRVVVLDSMIVKAQATARARQMQQFYDRRRTAVGYFRDSAELARFNAWSGVLNEMPMAQIQCAGCAIPKITIDRCTPEYWIDRQRVEPIDFGALRPADVASIEIYARNKVPGELQVKGVSVPGRRGSSPCAIWVITKRGIG